MSRWTPTPHQDRRDPSPPLSILSGPYPSLHRRPPTQCQRHSLVRLSRSSHTLAVFSRRLTSSRRPSDRRGWRWRGPFRLPICRTCYVRFRRSPLVLTSRPTPAHHNYRKTVIYQNIFLHTWNAQRRLNIHVKAPHNPNTGANRRTFVSPSCACPTTPAVSWLHGSLGNRSISKK